MAAIAPITINDGAAVPVAHVFAPQPDIMSELAKWVDKVGGIALGFPTITMNFRAPSKSSRAYKVTSKVVTPVLEVTSPSTGTGIQPAPTLSYNLLCNMDWVCPERSTLAQRKDLFAFVVNLLTPGSNVVRSAVVDLEPVW